MILNVLIRLIIIFNLSNHIVYVKKKIYFHKIRIIKIIIKGN